METVLVFGRRRPNNDSIMSSLVLAQLRSAVNASSTYRPMRLGKLPHETAAMFEAWELPELPYLDRIAAPLPGEPVPRVILTDHNEAAQSVPGIEYANVIGVVDHHRVAGFRSFAPVAFLALPWGSTCTIVSSLFHAYGLEPTKVQAACLLSAIMTDTLLLKSPATTDADRTYTARLAERLGTDPLNFGREVFRFRHAERFTPSQMVMNDVHRFEVGDYSLVISKYEAHDVAPALDQLPELRATMEDALEAFGITTGALCITDLTRGGTHLLVAGDPTPFVDGLGSDLSGDPIWLPGVVSRKAQIEPGVLAALEARG